MSCSKVERSFFRHVTAIRIALVLWVVFTGCEDPGKTTTTIFSVDSLVSAHTGYLRTANATLTKVAFIGNEKSEEKFKPDSLQWEEEMRIFRHLDVINKPVYRDVYRVTTSADKNSNLTVRRYAATVVDAPVTQFSIYYLDHLTRIKRVEARYEERNVMFSARRDLVLEFGEKERKPYLSAYSVKGGQKMLLGDTVQYIINGRISLPAD